MSRIRSFSVGELLLLEEKYEPIIDKIFMHGDTMLIKAMSKTGKTVLAQQMAHAISSGNNFLGVLETEKLPVAYISGEGYIGNWKERFINMSKLYEVDHDNFHFFECTQMQLHTSEGGQKLIKELKNVCIDFKVFVFDPIMFLCVGGDFNSSKDMGQFFANVEMIKRVYNGSAIVVHHDSEKIFIDKFGEKHANANDKTSMGSTAINAVITHSYTLTKIANDKMVMHRMTLANERASFMVKQLDLFMICPEEDKEGRLGYTIFPEEKSSSYSRVMHFIQNKKSIPNTKIEDNKELEGISRGSIFVQLDRLLNAKLINKVKIGNKCFYNWCGDDEIKKIVERGCVND